MIHTLGTKYEWTYEHFNKFQMFQTNVLFLGYQDHNGHNYASWNKLIITIREFVMLNDIKLILFDCTHDPYILDDKDTGYAPKILQQQEQLSHICKTVIVTEDWNYYYNPQPNILFFAYNLWIQSTRNLDAYYENQISGYDTTINKTKPLMCLNRNLHWHRLYMLQMVYNEPWLPLVDFSFILPIKDRYNDYNIKQHLTQDERSKIEKISTPIYLDYEGDKEIRPGYSNGASNVDTLTYSRCAVNLVTETSVNQGVALTEKTAKAFMAYQIPVLITNPGANQFLEDIGIDMFSDYVPWKDWDNIEDSRSRIDKIIEFINSIMQDPDAIMEKHKELHPRLIKNKETFHSLHFADKLLGPDI